MWTTENYTVILQYLTNPMHQLALRINKKAPKIIGRSSRKGTILDLITVDINRILLSDELDKQVSYREEEDDINYIDYKFHLSKSLLGVFDILTIRLFSKERVFNLQTQTLLTFTSSKQQNLKILLKICDDIMNIYGSDWNGYSNLSIGEVDRLEKNKFWSGRRWHMNEVNCLCLPDDNVEDIYWIEIGLDEIEGFTVTIGCYNKIVEYFLPE